MRRSHAAISVVVAVVLVAGVAVVATGTVGENDRGATPATPTPTSEPAPTPSDPQTVAEAVEKVIPELSAFVERERGLQFKAPVKVSVLAEEAFKARLLDDTESTEEDKQEIRDLAGVLRALHLLEPGVDLEAALDDLLGGAVTGFYDPETDELVVRGSAVTPYVRQVLVHELTHALQDQHFDLDREYEDITDEKGLGFEALVEGDALRIDGRYRDAMSDADDAAAQREEGAQGGDFDDVPEALLGMLAFPYATGPGLVEAILDEGGQARLDAAFAKDAVPATAEHVLHPERYLAGEPALPVERPLADGDVIDEGVVGELGLLLLFSDEGERGVDAADGWGGDRYVAWHEGDRTCVRATLRMDSGDDLAELERSLRRWGERASDATVRAEGDRAHLTSCG